MSVDTITIRTNPGIAKAISKLAKSMDRSRNWVIEAALKNYIELQAWQVKGIEEAIEQVNAKKVVSHEKVFSELRAKVQRRQK